jgi:hypothetical protein
MWPTLGFKRAFHFPSTLGEEFVALGVWKKEFPLERERSGSWCASQRIEISSSLDAVRFRKLICSSLNYSTKESESGNFGIKA